MPTAAPRVANTEDFNDVLDLAPSRYDPRLFEVPDVDFGRSLDLPSLDLTGERAALTAMLTQPGQSPYTPELTAQTLDLIRRRQQQRAAEALAGSQSDFMSRGGTGSSTEYFARNALRGQYDQAAADEELQFLLGASDRAAEERRFRTQTALSLYGSDAEMLEAALGRQFSRGQIGLASRDAALNRLLTRDDTLLRLGENRWSARFQADQDEIARAHEERLAEKYMAQLAAQQAAERRRRRRSGIASGIGAIGGGVIGGVATAGNPMGIAAGSGVGSNLGFLFA